MKAFRLLFLALKWTVIVLALVELFSFTVILASNYILYGEAREGSRAFYDPYTIFLQSPKIRPTIGSRQSGQVSDNFVIWVFGGSTVRGDTDHDELTIPSHLAKTLNARNTPINYSVVNFGVNSFNSLLETKYLQKALIEKRPTPDLVIFYDGANDVKYFLEHRHPYGHHGYRKLKAVIESYHASLFGLLKPLNAALYSSFTMELYDKINQVFIPVESDPELVKKFADMTERRYDFVNKLVQCFGARFLLIYQPMLWAEECTISRTIAEKERSYMVDSEKFNTMRANFAIPYKIMLERMKDKPYFVSYEDALCEREQPSYKPDGVHLTDYGRHLIAMRMSKTVDSVLGLDGK